MFPSFRKVMARTFSVPKIALEVVSLFLTLTGFLLVFLSLLSNGTEQLKSLYFLKLSASNMTITFGLYNYCMTKGDSSTVCFEDDSIMVVPYDVNIVNMFNTTFPELFTDFVTPEISADPDPPHDPKIYVASVLCLLLSGASTVFCILKFIHRTKFQDDIHFNRGFLVAGSCACALLLIALCTVIYSNAVIQLNSTYPHITASLGPCVSMIGASFMVFFMSSVISLQGCWGDKNAKEKYSYESV